MRTSTIGTVALLAGCNPDDLSDADAPCGSETLFYADEDADGWGHDADSVTACVAPEGYVGQAGDCDDQAPDVHPGQLEPCDAAGLDQDCDGLTDPDDPDVVTWLVYADDDGDGYGGVSTWACDPSGPATGGDCDDGNPLASPAGTEVCDDAQVDEDCDGFANEADPEGPIDGTQGWYDQDGDGWGGAGPVWICAGESMDQGGDCDDLDAAIHPEAGEDCHDGVDEDCDGVIDDCGTIPAIDLDTNADGTLAQSGADYGWAGASVAWVGDMNGDAAPDYVVGAPMVGTTEAYAGVAYVMAGPGPLDGYLDTTAAITLAGTVWGGKLGTVVAGLGDVDGDTLGDFAVSATGEAGGTVYVYGATSVGEHTAEDAALAILRADTTDSVLGSALAGRADFDDDGYLDLAIGASYGPTGDGAAYVAYGPLSGAMDLAADTAVWLGTDDAGLLGNALAALDLSGDGVPELAVGAPNAESGAGRVYIATGGEPLGEVADADRLLEGAAPNDAAGHTLASAGDHDGDGYEDLAVAAISFDPAFADAGAVYLVYGPAEGVTDLGSVAAKWLGTAELAQVGMSLDGGGDANDDGLDDLLIGAPQFSDLHFQQGAAWMVLGPTEGTASLDEARVRMHGGEWRELAGASVAWVSDHDGDDLDDVIIGSPNLGVGPGSFSGIDPGGIYFVLGTNM